MSWTVLQHVDLSVSPVTKKALKLLIDDGKPKLKVRCGVTRRAVLDVLEPMFW